VEVVILIGTGVIAVFFWALLILIFCNAKRVRGRRFVSVGHTVTVTFDPQPVCLGRPLSD